MMKKLIILFTLACVFISLTGCTGDDRPNIVFIMTDQQSAHMMSCTGNQWLETPSMDRLAESGIRFERAYACNPICAPSRFSLQSGLMPSAIGMRVNQDDKKAAVTDKMIRESLGNLFRDAGYETVYGGKVHLPHRMLTLDKTAKRFKMLDLEKIGYRYLTNDKRGDLADDCVEFIKQEHEKPFLLFASFINPHDICYMGINDYRRSKGQGPENNPDSRHFEELFEQVRQQEDLDAFVDTHCPPLPDNFEIAEDEPEIIEKLYIASSSFQHHLRPNWTEKDWRIHRWAYSRLTELVDEKIGRILDALKDAGLEENTLIVFTSDHGDMDASHQLEHKGVLYEESIRIPFLLSYKGVIPAGQVDDTHLVSNGLDLIPTLCDFAGIPVPEDLPGASAKTLAVGKSVKNWRDNLVVESQNGRMVRTDRFKYSIYEFGKNREQLVDLTTDPGELSNLARDPQYKDVLEQHRRLLRMWIEKTGDNIGLQYLVAE